MDYAVVSTDGFVLHTTDMDVACREFMMRVLAGSTTDHADFDVVRSNDTEYIAVKQPEAELRLYGVTMDQWIEVTRAAGRSLN